MKFLFLPRNHYIIDFWFEQEKLEGLKVRSVAYCVTCKPASCKIKETKIVLSRIGLDFKRRNSTPRPRRA